MRRPLIAALVATMLLVWPVQAQTEHVLMDATFRAIPPTDGAPCMLIDAGRLTVQAINKSEQQTRPVVFRLNGYRGMDPSAQIELHVSQQESSITVPLAGALYCWSINVEAPVSFTDNMATRTNYTQVIGLRMTLSQ